MKPPPYCGNAHHPSMKRRALTIFQLWHLSNLKCDQSTHLRFVENWNLALSCDSACIHLCEPEYMNQVKCPWSMNFGFTLVFGYEWYFLLFSEVFFLLFSSEVFLVFWVFSSTYNLVVNHVLLCVFLCPPVFFPCLKLVTLFYFKLRF